MIKIGDKKRGRPIKLDALRRQINIRLTDKELARVYMLADKYGVSRNEAIRIAINKAFDN